MKAHCKLRMTNAELIECLQKYPPDIRVLVDGYENGFEELNLREVYVDKVQNPNWYDGDYTDENKASTFKALIISRKEAQKIKMSTSK